MRHTLILVLIVLWLHDGHAEEIGPRKSEDHAHEGSWAVIAITLDFGTTVLKYAFPATESGGDERSPTAVKSSTDGKVLVALDRETAVKSFGEDTIKDLENLMLTTTIVIAGESFEFRSKERLVETGVCIVDPKQSPKRMTASKHKPSESEPPKEWLAIYELPNDCTMVLCYNLTSGTFAKSFSAPPPLGRKVSFSGPETFVIIELQRLSGSGLQEKKTD